MSDIEELVSMAKQHEFCPYYLGRGLSPRAELVLMPYNYLLDPGTRRGIKAGAFLDLLMLPMDPSAAAAAVAAFCCWLLV